MDHEKHLVTLSVKHKRNSYRFYDTFQRDVLIMLRNDYWKRLKKSLLEQKSIPSSSDLSEEHVWNNIKLPPQEMVEERLVLEISSDYSINSHSTGDFLCFVFLS